jgi:hypothetical protein
MVASRRRSSIVRNVGRRDSRRFQIKRKRRIVLLGRIRMDCAGRYVCTLGSRSPLSLALANSRNGLRYRLGGLVSLGVLLLRFRCSFGDSLSFLALDASRQRRRCGLTLPSRGLAKARPRYISLSIVHSARPYLRKPLMSNVRPHMGVLATENMHV